MTGPLCTIRRYRSGHINGWRWTCRLCGVAGTHRFDRWTDHVLGMYGKAAPHPQQRCLAGAESHIYRMHRSGPLVNVNIYMGGQP